MKYTIYLRTNIINGKQYVGQTSNIKRRDYKFYNLKNFYANEYLTEERNKYGLENFKTEILEETDSREKAWDLEEKYIKEFDTKYPNGYNFSNGGPGTNGFKASEETRKKLSQKLSGLKRTNEFKKKVSQSLTNHPDKSKKVYQYDLDGNLIKVWESTKEVGRNGFDQSRVAELCRGSNRRKTHKGFIWKYGL